MGKINDRKIVVVNQAVNYLTIGLCNAFHEKFEHVSLITGSIHVQGEALNEDIKVTMINKWKERPPRKKMLSYLIGCIRIYWLLWTKYRKHEVFFVSLPPMAYLLNILLPHRFSMLIWDVYPDVFKITGMSESHPLYRIWGKLNIKSFKKAYRIFTIGEKMAELIAEYVDREKILVQPIWSIFQENKKVDKSENPFIKKHALQDKFIVQYSGNIGLTHKVEVMVELAAYMQDNKHILFQIIGRGPRVPTLKKIVEEKKLPNCQFLPFQSDEMFPYSLSAANVGVVILDELTSKGSVPSKSYNLMSYGIPSLYIASADSELKAYAEKYGHAACFSEKELPKAAEYITKLSETPDLYTQLAQNSINAAANFKRDNADKIITLYLK